MRPAHARRGVLAALLLISASHVFANRGGVPLEIEPRHSERTSTLWWDGERTVSAAAISALQAGDRVYLRVNINVSAPVLTSPARVPQCIDSDTVEEQLTKALVEAFPASSADGPRLKAAPVVDTRRSQLGNLCTYSSLVALDAADVKARLVEAANAGKLCELLAGFCAGALSAEERQQGYKILGSGADPEPALPSVITFNCTKSLFEQKLDHFNTSEARSFGMVFWVCTDAWPANTTEQEESGHIIVYQGAEGPLNPPERPIIFENARRLKALLVWVEHRYYGKSMPFAAAPDGQLATEQYRWLTIEQVLEDTSAVLAAVRKQYAVPEAVPVIAVGGSYGGQVSAYLRVARPDTFAAAIASSAPVHFMFGTPAWQATSAQYYDRITLAARVMGGAACSDALARGLLRMGVLAQTAGGRRQLAAAFDLCGDADAALPSTEDALALQREQTELYNGLAQSNNQPPLLGSFALACGVVADTLAAGGDQLAAVAAVAAYYAHDGSKDWCYNFSKPATTVVPMAPGYSSYSYQTCAEGCAWSSTLPAARGRPGRIAPPYRSPNKRALQADCRKIFGADAPAAPDVPAFARDIESLLLRVGGVVFTNGELDGWAGGSLLSGADLLMPAGAGGNNGTDAAVTAPALAYITYANGSHCVDLRTGTGDSPGQLPEWRAQRAEAVDAAAAFAAPWRSARLARRRH